MLCSSFHSNHYKIPWFNISAGCIVTTSIQNKDRRGISYESLFHISIDGNIKGVLPFIGKGLHSFKSFKLPPNEVLYERHMELPFRDGGRFLYFNDCLGALACVFLPWQIKSCLFVCDQWRANYWFDNAAFNIWYIYQGVLNKPIPKSDSLILY